jgi:hypothetical protein
VKKNTLKPNKMSEKNAGKPFSSWRVVDLKAFLKERGKRCSGSKEELVRLAIIYKDTEVPRPSTSTSTTSTELSDRFDNPVMQWKDVNSPNQVQIPPGFDINSIMQFFTQVQVLRIGEDEDEDEDEGLADVSTAKPTVKGRQMYLSEKIFLLQVSSPTDQESLIFRGNVQASMKKKDFRYVNIELKSVSGEICGTRCTCLARADGRCAHVACLLYGVEALSLGVEPLISKPGTSKQQSWGRGSSKKVDPAPVYQHQ